MTSPGRVWPAALRLGVRSRQGWLACNVLIFAPLLVLLTAVDRALRPLGSAAAEPALIFGGFLAVVQGAGRPFLGFLWVALFAALVVVRLLVDGKRALAVGTSPWVAAGWLAVLLGSLACGDWLTVRYAGQAAADAGWWAYGPGVVAVGGLLGVVRFYWRLATARSRR